MALVVAASTIAEFWRNRRGLAEARFGLLSATVVPVDSILAKRAGELLRQIGGAKTLDAIVVAVAEQSQADRIYTSDVGDMELLLSAAQYWECDVVAV
jgi:PIN domain-containing protein